MVGPLHAALGLQVRLPRRGERVLVTGGGQVVVRGRGAVGVAVVERVREGRRAAQERCIGVLGGEGQLQAAGRALGGLQYGSPEPPP